MKIEKTKHKGKSIINVYVDKSNLKGIIRFGHEISVTFVEESGELKFDSAWHIGVSELSWNSDEEELFESMFPGLLVEMRNEIVKKKHFELASRIFDCISDGYDDEEQREMIVNSLCDELSNLDNNSFIEASFEALCERIEELEI